MTLLRRTSTNFRRSTANATPKWGLVASSWVMLEFQINRCVWTLACGHKLLLREA
jgi:hypothetical protein